MHCFEKEYILYIVPVLRANPLPCVFIFTNQMAFDMK